MDKIMHPKKLSCKNVILFMFGPYFLVFPFGAISTQGTIVFHEDGKLVVFVSEFEKIKTNPNCSIEESLIEIHSLESKNINFLEYTLHN
jgi:hypothetical protein